MSTRLLAPAALVTVLCAVALAGPPAAEAQNDLTLEFGGSQIGPPIGIEGDVARYLMAGIRGSHFRTNGSGIFASVLLGQTLNDAAGGNFLAGVLEGSLVDRWGPYARGVFDVRLMGHGAQTPYPFRAFAAEGGPSLRVRTPRIGFELSGVGGVGLSQIELFLREDGPRRRFDNDLWRYGTQGEFSVGPVTSNIGITGGWHRTAAGDYANIGGRLVFAGSWGLAEIQVDRWTTPTATETTGGIALILPLGSLWNLRGFFGRTDPDPLTLAQPGSGSGGFLVGRSLVSDAPSLSAVDLAIARVVEYGEGSNRVRFSVEAPAESATVSVTGDFTLWQPVLMEWDGSRWSAEIAVPVGIHHFGFLIDGEWHVPDDAPDVVPDEWGRMNATLVIEGATP